MDLSTHNLAAHDSERDDRRVMTLTEWCQLNSFSVDTGKRLIKSGRGPRVLQLSDRRIGITVAANREWQQARERA
jgi:predicted DNA-binding transcriptional regulator AlpA